METKQRSTQQFCVRPGCGIAKSMHGKLTNACGNYIDPMSKWTAAHLSDATKVETAGEIVSSRVNAEHLMLEHESALARIGAAKLLLQKGLASSGEQAQAYFKKALRILGNLGGE